MKKLLLVALFFLLCIAIVAAQGIYSCPVQAKAKTASDFIAEIPALNSALQGCPVTLKKSVSNLAGSGIIQINIAMNDGSTERFIFIKNGQQVSEVKTQVASFYHFLIRTDKDSVDALLQSTNRFETFSTLYQQKKIKISGGKFLSKVRLFFTKPIISFVTKQNQGSSP